MKEVIRFPFKHIERDFFGRPLFIIEIFQTSLELPDDRLLLYDVAYSIPMLYGNFHPKIKTLETVLIRKLKSGLTDDIPLFINAISSLIRENKRFRTMYLPPEMIDSNNDPDLSQLNQYIRNPEHRLKWIFYMEARIKDLGPVSFYSKQENTFIFHCLSYAVDHIPGLSLTKVNYQDLLPMFYEGELNYILDHGPDLNNIHFIHQEHIDPEEDDEITLVFLSKCEKIAFFCIIDEKEYKLRKPLIS